MNAYGCHVRRATPEDVDEMADLLAMLFGIEREFSIDREKQKRGLVMLLNSEITVIHCAEIKGQVVGMCSAQGLVSTAMGGLSALVEDLVVHEHHRGKGIGTLLLGSMEAWAKENGVTRLQLLADQENTKALAFYAKLRWGETGMMCRRKYV
jgi:GNAT superfamily N-acetyltransferase